MIHIIQAKKEHLDTISEMAFNLMIHHEKIDKLYAVVPDAKDIWKEYVSQKLNDENSRVVVAETDNKKIIGYALSHIISRPPVYRLKKIGDVSDCFVTPDYRGNFVSVKLINDAVDWFMSKGVTTIGGQVDIRNERSAKLWQMLGYEPYILKLIRDHNE